MSAVLSGKTAVITGASRGLGWAIAEAYGAEGASLVIGSRSAEAVADAVERLKAKGMSATGTPCDVTSPAQIARLAEHARRTFGGFDIWINNAGVAAPYGATVEVDPAKFEQVVATNIL
ncbi:MAG TPA: SDR family NAD(P)-dependent oxidoreductase, partial [Anaerolineales bacterium]|nr:SDR family NAD(P)-dependent oxidoreductase [Anaerolineales bacterium]